MARRLIGLDVGTNAVTVAEVTPGSPPRLERFGQVALPRDAMREGEVADDLALIEAITRLRTEVDLKKAAVRIGVSSPRIVVRQVEMPVMTPDELASALKFQAADLIPIPIEEAVLDFAILGTDTNDGGEQVMRVLLAAAQEASIARLVTAVERSGFAVDAVDLVPLALIRSLARPSTDEEPGAEGIVSFGGGVTSIAVHEGGVPRFVRVLSNAGRELTDAIASDLDIPAETAEALKRQLATGSDELVVRARAAIERPLSMLLDEVRGSFDYYRNQPGAARLTRVIVTGGASQLPGLPDRLAMLVGVPVEPAAPRDTIAIGDIHFAPEEYPRLDPYLPASVGLALGGANVGTIIDLSPKSRPRRAGVAATASKRTLVRVGAIAAGLVAVLAVPTVMAQKSVSDKKAEKKELEAHNAELQAEIASYAPTAARQQELQAIQGQLTSLLATDVSWARMLDEISATMPANVWLTGFNGQVVVPAAAPAKASGASSEGDTSGGTGTEARAAAAPLPTGIQGVVSIDASGIDYPDVSEWLKTLGDPTRFPSFVGLWVSEAASAQLEQFDVVDFTSSARLTDYARSNRLEQFKQGVGQ